MSGARAEARFVTGSTMRHVVVMTLTGMAGLTFMFVVDAAALFWVSQLGEEVQMAALGFAWTVQFAAISVAIGLMIGTMALVSRAEGRGARDLARSHASFGYLMALVVMSAVALGSAVFARPLIEAQGASGETLERAVRFLHYSAPSLVLISLSMSAMAVLRAIGAAWPAMFVTLSSGGAAMLLDPLLIYWLGWGSDGAAVALVLSRIASSSIGLYFCAVRFDMLGSLRWAHMRAALPIFAAIALPAVVTQLAPAFGNLVVTEVLAAQSASAVAGWSVVNRVLVVTFGGIFALSTAISGIFGQNYGANRPERVLTTYRDALIFCGIYVLGMWALMWMLADPLIALFGLSQDGALVAGAFFRYAAGGFFFVGALFIANAAFNVLDRPLWSTGFNWLKDAVLTVPLVWYGAALAAGPGAVLGQGIAAVIAGLLAYLWGWRYIMAMQTGRS